MEHDELLIEIHGDVKSIVTDLQNVKQDVHNGKEETKAIRADVDDLQGCMRTEMIYKTDCMRFRDEDIEKVGQVVQSALNGKKRARGLLVKDILLTLFAAGGTGTILILWILEKIR